MPGENILKFIPQRHPFVMIDELLFADEKNVVTQFTVKANNILSEEQFFSEAGLLENIAQSLAAGNGFNELRSNQKISGGFIAGVKNFEVFFRPGINDVLKTETQQTNVVFNMIIFTGRIFVKDALCAQCEMKVFTNTND